VKAQTPSPRLLAKIETAALVKKNSCIIRLKWAGTNTQNPKTPRVIGKINKL